MEGFSWTMKKFLTFFFEKNNERGFGKEVFFRKFQILAAHS
jgi:hypothetical protein